jgi:hypothetical protein
VYLWLLKALGVCLAKSVEQLKPSPVISHAVAMLQTKALQGISARCQERTQVFRQENVCKGAHSQERYVLRCKTELNSGAKRTGPGSNDDHFFHGLQMIEEGGCNVLCQS